MELSIAHEESDRRGAFYIDHTEVAPSLGGKGVARKLLDATVTWARQTHTKLRATCPYASAQFARDPSIRDVLA